MNRRNLVVGAFAASIAYKVGFAWAMASNVAERVEQIQKEIATRQAAGKIVPGTWVASRLGEGLTPRERSIAAFHLVQNIPYKLTKWTGDPDSLFTLGRGDCRHKAGGLLRLFRSWKMEARPIMVLFDWADLPIPSRVTRLLVETRGVHDSVELKIDGRFVAVDATWDPALGKVGFPMLSDWNGISPTLPITKNANVVIGPLDLPLGTNVLDYFKLKPDRERTLLFNRAFNAWADEVRSRARAEKG